jgi:hypothetical protein
MSLRNSARSPTTIALVFASVGVTAPERTANGRAGSPEVSGART